MDWTSPDKTVRLLTGHVLERLLDLPDASVHAVVTSPPYWGLRRYGVDGEFGAEPLHDCLGWATGSPCGECFVCHLVAVMRAVRRVLHPSGTVWLNLGDSFCNAGSRNNGTGFDGHRRGGMANTDGTWKSAKREHGDIRHALRQYGTKHKDQCMIPARTALAIQADGWWVRSDVIWVKPNGMPGSQEDRPTINHEYVYLLAKSERYFYDHFAIREKSLTNDPRKVYTSPGAKQLDGRKVWHSGEQRNGSDFSTRTARSVWTITPQPFRGAMCRACRTVYLDGTQRFPRHDGDKAKPICPTCGVCDQWLSHFAVMPERLAERCILAGTSERDVCPQCKEPWRRVLGDKQQVEGRGSGNVERKIATLGERGRTNTHMGTSVPWNPTATPTIRWEPGCQCVDGPFPDFIGDRQPTVGTCSYLEPVPAMVLDPFAGTGTTLAVARRLGRHALGIELNPDYAEICQARVMAPPRKPKTKPAIIPDARQQTLF